MPNEPAITRETLEEYINRVYGSAGQVAGNFRSQNFGPNDSVIASTINHPIEATKRAGEWLTKNINTAAGIPEQYDNPDPLIGYTPHQQALAALNIAGLAGTGAIPFNQSGPATVGTFAGMGSKTAPRLNRLIAQDMEKAGASSDEIFQKTGWFRGGDEGWRYEINDAQARMKLPLDDILESKMFSKPTQTYTLGDVLHHPELYKAYPEAEKIPFVKRQGFFDFGGLQGWRGDNEIGLTPYSKDPLGTLIHETQHYIQEKEGFGLGGNAKTVWDVIPEQEKLKAAEQAVNKLNDSIGTKSREIQLAEQVVNHPMVNDYTKAPREIFGKLYHYELTPEQKEALYLARYPEQYNKAVDKLKDLHNKLTAIQSGDIDALKKNVNMHTLYKRLHGETEARNVTERRKMTSEERKTRPAWETQEYPWEQQFVSKNK
jgi:hypothetical protein